MIRSHFDQSTHAVDFIPRLPPELIHFIFRSFDTDELVEFTKVSKQWKQSIANCSSLWRRFTVADDEIELIQILDSVGEHVRTYHVTYGCQEVLDGSLDKLTSGHMDHVQMLKWHNCEFAHEHILQPIKHLQHLTELIITVDHEDWDMYEPSVPDLPTILGACPHLKRLDIDMTDNDVFKPLQPIDIDLPSNLQLTHLNWSNGSNTEEYTINAVLAACPKLQYVMIGQCDQPDLLSIRNHCPETTWFLSINNDWEVQNKLKRQWIYDHKQEEPGLCTLGFNCEGDAHVWTDLVAVMEEDQGAIEKLVLQVVRPPIHPRTLLKNFYAEHVTYLSCEYLSCDASLIVQLFRKCPNIRQADIGAGLELMDGEEELSLPPSLKTLVLTNRFSRDEEEIEWLINGIRKSTTLHTLKLREFDREPPMYAFYLLANLPHLTKLEFHLYNFSELLLMDYAISLQNPNLVSIPALHFHGPKIINDLILVQLVSASKLTKVAVHSCHSVTDKGVRYLVSNAANLKSLDIVRCLSVTKDTVKYVNETLSNKNHM
ncbi:hypothetical protein BJV82DRAFT_609421 [Fennellomyces sp. T-0311]|nr:hypothetical protein BJV82DRAFT_609421 [Fennellomyces sp. T-0311]